MQALRSYFSVVSIKHHILLESDACLEIWGDWCKTFGDSHRPGDRTVPLTPLQTLRNHIQHNWKAHRTKGFQMFTCDITWNWLGSNAFDTSVDLAMERVMHNWTLWPWGNWVYWWPDQKTVSYFKFTSVCLFVLINFLLEICGFGLFSLFLPLNTSSTFMWRLQNLCSCRASTQGTLSWNLSFPN